MPEQPVPSILDKSYFPNVPKEEINRPHYGRSVDLRRIESALRAAQRGHMRQLTDLSLETIGLDGHASALLQKRLNRLAALDWQVEPASGPGIDEDRAEEVATLVRAQLELIPSFRQKIQDIGWGAYHGRSAMEIAWGFDGKHWAATDLHWIHPRRLSFGPNRDLRVVDLRSDRGEFQDIGFPLEAVPYKFITYTPRLFGEYPEREGLAPRTLYWSFFARFGTRERMGLLEIFGKPWRIIQPQTGPDAVAPNKEQLDQAFAAVNSLGANSTARLPVAMDLHIEQPQTNAGQVHQEAIDHANQTMSKLYLGQTGTTDAISTGLGSTIGDVHLSEEDLIIAGDAWRVSEAIEDQLTDAIVIVNFGPAAVRYAPRFRLRTDPPMDRQAEAGLLKSSLEVGFPIAEAEARERLGYRELRDDDVRLVLPEQPAPIFSADASGRPVAPRPATPPPVANDIELDADVAPAPTPVDIRQAIADEMTEHGIPKCEHGRPNRCPQCGIERVRHVTRGADGEPEWTIAWQPIGGGAPAVDLDEDVDDEGELLAASGHGCSHSTLLAGKAPATLNGSPEELIERGVAAGAVQTGKLAAAIVGAVQGKTTARAILAAAKAAARKFSLREYENIVERELLSGAMLGALDSDWEGAEGRPIEVEAFSDLWPDAILLAATDSPFASHPLQKALDVFSSRQVVTRPVFDTLLKAAKARAFTVAGASSDSMVATVQAELTAQVAKGAELRDFAKHAAARLESAGWTPVNPSHVETVFRTNVQNAYSDGRYAQVTDPDVMELRPYLQVLTVRDSRTRPTHRKAHGLVFRTEDVDRDQLTPFGYNCRCRFRSMSARQVEGMTINDPSALATIGLPDPGFN